ncbi:MAG: Rne/Rng family ribonuclease, partial [Candidatus Eutrophobiaceae bacterium]
MLNSEILINVTPHETRVALVASGLLQQIYIERRHSRSLVGNIYKGRVTRIMPGLQAAFIDLESGRSSFLGLADINTTFLGTSPEESPKGIEKLLHEGQEILVQAKKDPIGNKAIRISTHLSLPSRYAVLTPHSPRTGVSLRIRDLLERRRLYEIMENNSAESGFILRSAAEHASPEEINQDANYLRKLWITISEQAQHAKAPTLIHEEPPLALRAIRDLADANVEKICIDCKENHQKLMNFSRDFMPSFLDRIEYYADPQPIFDRHFIEDEIQKSLNRRVPLQSGGHLIFDQTEAMTTIDVNTGKFTGTGNPAETLYKTNLEAANAIARQITLRNIGGIIIVDFIDMNRQDHRNALLKTLEEHLAQSSNTPTKISELSSLGLVQISRKRSRESLEKILCATCPDCNGRGMVKSVKTICYEVFREIQRKAKQFNSAGITVLCCAKIADTLLNDEFDYIAQLEHWIGKPIKVQTENLYTQEQFSLI